MLVEPWITEKTHAAMADNKYAFKVTAHATKTEVKKAVEGMYKVKVEKIAMVNLPAKIKNYGRYERKQAGVRKAIITLKEGDKIEFFQGA
ncbi:MAG TPA: 50S ribosomal protein L23 [Patescibacteria group bacterium]